VTVPPEVPLRHANGCHWGRFVRTIIELETDDGLVGLGELGGGGESAEAMVHGLRPHLLGHDPARLEEMRLHIALFADSGHIQLEAEELFRTASWLFVMVGQGVMPRHHHHMGALPGDERLRRALDSLRGNIARAVGNLPVHREFLQGHCTPVSS
jgi:hypothetical protein